MTTTTDNESIPADVMEAEKQREFSIACSINPELFSTIPYEAIQAASPLTVDAARAELLEIVRMAVANVKHTTSVDIADEYYARGYGLRCMIVDFLNSAINRDELRKRFSDWEYGCTGTRFSTSPAQIAGWSKNAVAIRGDAQ